jgi:UDP-glucose 4-epimerase
MQKTALVTGGAGFIGSHLCERLIAQNFRVICLDNLSTGRKENLDKLKNNPNFTFIKGDVRNQKDILDPIKKADIIYHLAAVVGVENVIKNPIEDMEVNYEGSKNIIETAFKNGEKKIVFTSSSEVYGKNTDVPLSEDTTDEVFGSTSIPRWIYGHSKALVEHLLFCYSQKGLPMAIVRYFNCYGPKGINNKYANVIPLFIQKALTGQDIPVFNNGSQSRCFCFVDDTVEGTIRTGESVLNEIINIGSNNEISINNLAKEIILLTNSKSKIIYIDPEKHYGEKFEEALKRTPDIKKAKNILDWQPTVSLKEGLTKTIGWTKEQIKI